MKSFWKWFCLPSFLLLSVCQPLRYSSLTPLKSGENLTNSDLQPVNQDEMTKIHLSNTLDLVFVLSTSPNMKSFYKQNLFGADFLSRFNKYDWRFGWTDMSVDIEKFKEEEKKKKEKEEENKREPCPWIRGLMWLGLGFFTDGMALAFAGRDIGECVDRIDDLFPDSEEKSNFTNGAFLPFEYEGEKPHKDQSDVSYLTKSIKNYNGIFDHSMRWGNKGEKDSYKAPGQTKEKAYPFVSLFLSMRWGSAPPEEDSEEKPFFREDSSIVYVLVTVDGFQKSIPPEEFKSLLLEIFGSEDRLRIIPVTLNQNSSLACRIHSNTDPSNMIEFSKNFGGSSIDICSQNLGEELFEEISKSLLLQKALKEQS